MNSAIKEGCVIEIRPPASFAKVLAVEGSVVVVQLCRVEQNGSRTVVRVDTTKVDCIPLEEQPV